MPLPVPNLDDRSFEQLVDEAKARIAVHCPEWTDFSPGDPGMMLVELFAYLTDTLLYRLNRVPEKAYVSFLNLIGVRLDPPAAARVELRFTASRTPSAPFEIPRGTLVSVARTGGTQPAPVFVTEEAVTITPDQAEATVTAYHCETVEGELVGTGAGSPGQSVRLARPPVILATEDELDLVVGVEAAPGELGEREAARHFGGKSFRIWREVADFSDRGPNRFVYVADRLEGLVTFAPAARMTGDDGRVEMTASPLGEVPPTGREIRAWYRRGGGVEGNVAAGTLTVLKTPVPGVEVTNPAAATGGRAAETLANALVRGPQQFHTLERAVTARDFELVATRTSGTVARAKAFTKAELWVHAVPGTVEVLLVPSLAGVDPATATEAEVRAHQTSDALERVRAALDARRPLGTTCLVNWAHCKTVRVEARVVLHRAEDPAAVRRRLDERLRKVINPLPNDANPAGWRFGQALRASHVYDVLLSERGVRFVDRVRILVDEVPEGNVTSVTADPLQPRTWYCGSGPVMFRSMDDGDGWEPAGRFPDEVVEVIRPHPVVPGLVVVASRMGDSERSRLRFSRDCGETWEAAAELDFHVEDIAVLPRGTEPVLLLATDRGLYEQALGPGAVPVQVLVDPANAGQGFYAVAVVVDVQGRRSVVVAAQKQGGIYLSSDAGRPGTFRSVGLRGIDVRVLITREDGPRRFVVGGVTTFGDDPGTGAHSLEILGTEIDPQGWRSLNRGWNGGSCYGLAVSENTLLAATHLRGVMRLALAGQEAPWEAPTVDAGLPLRDPGRFQPVAAVAVAPTGGILLAGGAGGVHRSADVGVTFSSVSEKVFAERVTLPPTWLFCSGAHDLEVVSEDATGPH